MPYYRRSHLQKILERSRELKLISRRLKEDSTKIRMKSDDIKARTAAALRPEIAGRADEQSD